MIDKGKTQQALAVHLDLSQQAISRRLRGTVPFSALELMKTAEFLEVPMADLLPGVAA